MWASGYLCCLSHVVQNFSANVSTALTLHITCNVCTCRPIQRGQRAWGRCNKCRLRNCSTLKGVSVVVSHFQVNYVELNFVRTDMFWMKREFKYANGLVFNPNNETLLLLFAKALFLAASWTLHNESFVFSSLVLRDLLNTVIKFPALDINIVVIEQVWSTWQMHGKSTV